MQTFTKHEVLEYAAELLREWGDGKLPPKPYYGICENLDVLLEEWTYLIISSLSPFWCRFSGDPSYPVPSLFCAVFEWDDSEEGDDRRDLCHFLADEIEEYLETGEC